MITSSLRAFRLRWLVALIFAFFVSAGQLSAQDAAADFAEMSLEDLLNVEVSVASKSNETLSDAPSSVTVFTRQEIENLGVTTLEDLLNYVPGFAAMRTEEDVVKTNRIAIRGRISAADSFDVLLLMDGQRLNDQLIGGALRNNNHITLANVKQIEVIRGPGSALYGSNAFLGVVNIVTDNTSKEGYIATGNIGSYEANASMVGDSAVGKWSVFARGLTDKGDFYDLEDGIVDLTGQPTTTKDPMQAVDFYATLQNDNFRANFRYMGREQRDFTQIGNSTDGLRYADTRVSSMNFTYKPINNDKNTLSIYGGFITSELDAVVPLVPAGAFGAGATRPDMLVGGDVQDQSQITLALDYNHQFSEKNQLSAGASFEQADMDTWHFQANFDVNALFFGRFPITVFPDITIGHGGERGNLEKAERDILGLYVQDKHNFNENLSLTLGVRFDDYSDAGNTTNPRGALVYRANGIKSTFKLMYGQAFRAPSFKEKFEFSLTYAGNEQLEPEEIKTTELAWILKLSKFQSTLTYYSSKIDNGVVQTSQVFNGWAQLHPVNLETLDLTGFEWEGQMAVTDRFLLRGSASLMDKVEALKRSPDTLYTIAGNYSAKRFNINLSSYFHDKVNTPVNTQLEDFWLYNATFRYNVSPSVQLWLKAQNLGDEEYYTYTVSANNDQKGIPNRGMTSQIGLKVAL